MHQCALSPEVSRQMNRKGVKEHEEIIFSMLISDALYDLLWHDLLHFFTLPSGIGHVTHPNWHCIHGEFNIRDYFRTYFRKIIG